MQGGTNRFVHGGATLQELVIPLVKVNIKKSKESIKDVDVEKAVIDKALKEQGLMEVNVSIVIPQR